MWLKPARPKYHRRMLILFLPLVPVFKMFEGIRDRHEDE